jgi:hypothetical protein
MPLDTSCEQYVFGLAALPLLFGPVEQHLPLPQTIITVERTKWGIAAPEALWTQLTNWYAIPLATFLVDDFEDTALAFYTRRAEEHSP